MSISSICITAHQTIAHQSKALIQITESSALSQWRLAIMHSTSTLEWCSPGGKAVAQRLSGRLGRSIAALLLIALATLGLWRPIQAQDITQSIAYVDSPSIIGGTIADQDAWPWMVALVRPETEDSFWAQFCAGTLIAPDWVLTAAHCTLQSNKPVSPERIQVLLTSGSLGSDTNQRIGLRQIIQHPNYARVRGDSDLALLQLERPVERAAINLVAHDDSAAELTGRTATVLGWGRTEDVFRSNALMQVDVPLVMPTTCIDAYAALGYIITDNMLCAGYSVGGKDACTGDSGGPLMVSQVDGNGQQSWKIIGIVSWGKDCAKPNAYGVYTRLSQFTTWIQVQTGIDRTIPQTAQPFPTSTIPVPGLSQNRFHFFVPISILTP